MSGSDKVERDYRDFDSALEELAKEEIAKIKMKAATLKLEAEKVGETVEASLKKNKVEPKKKKS